jgi:hypothetical protein
MGERAFSKVQFGKETAATHGMAVAADTILAGAEIFALNPDRTPSFPMDNLGVRAAGSRVRIDQYLAANTLRIPDLYFQALPAILSCGLKGNITPAEQTPSQNDMLWAHTPSMTASNAIDSLTLEAGDDTQAVEYEYLMFERIKLSGQIAQAGEAAPVVLEADWFARQATPTSFTGALSIPSMTDINAKLSRIYIDALWVNRGVTEKTSLIRSWDLEILTGVHPKFLGSADKFFTTHGQSIIAAMLTLSLERGASSDAEWDAYRIATKQAVRVKIDSGVQIGTGVNHSLTLDLFGAYENVILLGQEDRGNNIDTAVFHGLYDPTGAQIVDVRVITNLASI